NRVAGWAGDLAGLQMGMGLSERFANYALNSVYNSGLLCIGLSTENFAILNSGTLSLFMASLSDLGLQHEPQEIAVVLRPQHPPTVKFGNGTDIMKDPLLRVHLKVQACDFFAWSLDGFVPFMTATYDVDVPVNLTSTPDGLTPVIKTLGVTNGKLTNNALIKEDPDTIQAALAMLISGQVGQAIGGG